MLPLSKREALRPALLYAAWLLLFFVIFARSWVSEDAYITFRVIDNWLHGYGLRWNITERVQIYTHPLWLLIHLPFAYVWGDLFHLNIILSVTCSTLAIGIVLLTFRKSASVTLICFMLPLLLSKCFIEYAASGLETPLSYLLFAMLGYVITHWQGRSFFPLMVTLLSSLLLLNRLDHVLLIAPMLLYLSWRHYDKINHWKGALMLVCGAFPLVLWFSFSLVYYGFLFPNTKYAKLDTGWPLESYLSQGLEYSFIWLSHDTVSVLLTAMAVIFTLGRKESPAMCKALGLGILCQFAYVIYIGGDYMMGRFFAFIFFAASWMALSIAPARMRGDALFAMALAFICAWSISYGVRNIRVTCDACIPIHGRVLDARKTFTTNSLFVNLWPPVLRPEGQYKFGNDGKKMAAENPPPIKSLRYVGMAAYYAGPQAIFVDELGLGDVLLARLPADKSRPFYVGHYRRLLPKGYMDAVRDGTVLGMDPNLAAYYEKLRLITQGDLWDRERLITLLRFNFGQYDAYKIAYLRASAH